MGMRVGAGQVLIEWVRGSCTKSLPHLFYVCSKFRLRVFEREVVEDNHCQHGE